MNNRDYEVWAEMCQMCLRTERPFEATKAIAQALKYGLKDPKQLQYFYLILVAVTQHLILLIGMSATCSSKRLNI